MKFYSVTEMPSGTLDGIKIFELVGKQNFILFYDFKNSTSILGFDNYVAEDIKNKIIKEIPGIGFYHINYSVFEEFKDLEIFSVYRKVGEFENRFFYDVFNTMPKENFLGILFINVKMEEVNSVKTHLEDILSSKNVRETESSSRIFKTNSTTHRDLYYESEEKMMLNDIIESLNKSILSNGLAYKIFLVVPKISKPLKEYIDTHFLVLNKYEFSSYSKVSIIDYIYRKASLPFGADYAKEFINFYGSYNTNHTLPTYLPFQEDGIEVGRFLKDGVLESDLSIKVDPTAMNLGFIITGLPGSGKTREAMSILDSLLSKDSKKPVVFIITPTEEWKEFALLHKMNFIKLYEDNTPINFFRCPKTIEIEKFYGNLAMILSSAANAGPYRNPIEKCMLNAFRKVYIGDNNPEPTRVYNEIEESIIKYHGKRMTNGVKYTKHGENIKSALENLRGILSREQYCVKDGIRIEDFIENGAVFDISGTSTITRIQLYALILNQIYALTANFDTNGDDKLRLVICLEEAQTIFGDPYSPAVQDIKQRIQDFRKQGIGLFLLTHNVSDIDVGIRRLCQLKLYLKQSPDTALLASKDLIFGNVEQDDVVLKLKTLNSRVGAFSYISKKENEKRQQDTVFVKTKTYEPNMDSNFYNPINEYLSRLNLGIAKQIKCIIKPRVLDYNSIKSKELLDYHSIRLSYLGEEIEYIPFKQVSSFEFSLLENNEYLISLLDKRGRILKETKIKAAESIELDI